MLSSMQRHTTRYIVVALLIAAGAIGGFFVFSSHQRASAIDAAARDTAARIDRMHETAEAVAAAQHAYVAPGQPAQPWLEQSAMLLQQFPIARSFDQPSSVAGLKEQRSTRSSPPPNGCRIPRAGS